MKLRCSPIFRPHMFGFYNNSHCRVSVLTLRISQEELPSQVDCLQGEHGSRPADTITVVLVAFITLVVN